MRLARSFLYVPGNAPDKMRKALSGSSDALIIDLEDAVPVAGKEGARVSTHEFLDATDAIASASKQLWVRINRGPEGLTDLASGSWSSVTGLVLAKATVSWIDEVEDYIAQRAPHLVISPLLETPEAVLDARIIAQHARVAFLQLGEYDLAAEAGITAGDEGTELLWARSMVVMASAAASLRAPAAPVSIEVADTESFRNSTRALARLGFVGRACIHPAQVEIVHEVFMPTAAERSSAEAMLAAYDASLAEGSGVVLDSSGRMIDEARIRLARRVLALAAGDAR